MMRAGITDRLQVKAFYNWNMKPGARWVDQGSLDERPASSYFPPFFPLQIGILFHLPTAVLPLMGHLGTCPTEIVDQITAHVDLATFLSLRLTSRTLCSRCSQSRQFASYFSCGHVDLTESSLQNFAAITSYPHSPAHKLDDLIVTGLVFNPGKLAKQQIYKTNLSIAYKPDRFTEAEQARNDRDLRTLDHSLAAHYALQDSGADIKLLAKAFGNLARFGKATLKSLALDVRVFKDDAQTRFTPEDSGSGRSVFAVAAYAFRTTIQALAVAEPVLRVESFDAYSGLRECSIPCNEIQRGLEGVENEHTLSEAFRGVKTAMVSISERIVDGSTRDAQRSDDRDHQLVPPRDSVQFRPDQLKAMALDEKNWSGLASILVRMEGLKELWVQWYRLVRPRSLEFEDMKYERAFVRIVERVQGRKWEALKNVTLYGVFVTEEAMISFLNAAPALERVSLIVVRLLGAGSWRPVLDFISQDSQIAHLHLNDIQQDWKLIYFDSDAGKPKFPTRCHVRGPSEIVRDGREKVKSRISYHFARQRAVAGLRYYRWSKELQRGLGPPAGFL
jgi:hypothetical protein